VTLDENNQIQVQDITSENVEELSFRDRVIKMAVSYGHLVVCTTNQCHIYNIVTWNTPIMFDLRDTVNFIWMAEKYYHYNDVLLIYGL
jgi:intraflagellar transport protein 80